MTELNEDITVTMTAREWDSLQNHPKAVYAEHFKQSAQNKIAQQVLGIDERYQKALDEVMRERPTLNRYSLLAAIKRIHLGESLRENIDGLEINGDYLPHQKRPAHGLIVFSMPEKQFAGKYPFFTFTEKESRLILEICNEIGSYKTWNGFGSNYMSVEFAKPHARYHEIDSQEIAKPVPVQSMCLHCGDVTE